MDAETAAILTQLVSNVLDVVQVIALAYIAVLAKRVDDHVPTSALPGDQGRPHE